MEALRKVAGFDGLVRDYDLANISHVGTKGRVQFYIKPESFAEVFSVFSLIKSYGLPFFICGGCTNVLWGDGYFGGFLIDTRALSDFNIEDSLVIASCGVSLGRLIKACADAGLSGLENLYGIPGTVGGAVFMNAGAFGREIGELVEWIEVYDGRVFRLYGNEIGFSYRRSGLDGLFIMKVALRLSFSDKEKIKSKIYEILKKRKNMIPRTGNIGSVFKNPKGDFAGRLIEEAGLKGYSIGKVSVSERHANIFVSKEGATALDFVRLVNFVKEKIHNLYNILLEEEIVYGGSFVC